VRAIGEVLGKTVTWDGETKTVYVGTVPGTEENWMVKLPPYQTNGLTKVYDGTNPKETFTVGGVTKTSGIVLASTWYSGSIYAMWNTNAQYKSMTFTIANGNGDWDTTLEVYLDGDFSTSYDVKWDGGARTITVPLNYAANVKLALTNIAEYCIYDISFSE
jgi:hypothetical protein